MDQPFPGIARPSGAARFNRQLLRAMAMLSVLAPLPAFAAGTPAGTSIQNVATASFSGPNGTITLTSNTVVIKVDELLDVTVTSADSGDVPAQAGQSAALTFKITNTGNAPEAYTLTADVAKTGDNFDPTFDHIVIDANNNGQYDPGVDTIYVPGSNDPVIPPDSSITVFLVSDMPTNQPDGARAQAGLKATDKKGSGTPGTVFAGQGVGGGDAIVGLSTASKEADGYYRIVSANATLTKSASVLDPFGGTHAVPGAVVTYTLTATVTGTGSLTNLAIKDSIPAGMKYQPGSLTLGGVALTDAADSDAGQFDGTGITVSLGTVATGQSRVVTFKTVIQ